ncbi:phospholipid methyltransferase [Lachnotalea glycerini]|uniref:Isoprenylcysteine carboxylmethyltransferase family protein n=1 Tax=Lachnotalea glycerini TaxID=1763509 RepID=A0A318EUY0_9FIRM|nr:methyltransferase [Lachnotalea glycerini]PXV93302.1 phospholipid methyltransferase [Lachnotalea glycerini]RDY31881.1 isoprenylcysteine carboxylmethyltransferase family protein [Lachnotalea glycerini]
MLKYEERLHFDKHYKKLKECHLIRVCWILLSSTVWYTMIYIFLKFAISYLSDAYAWNDAQSWFTFERLKFVKIDLIYFIIGLLMIYYGSIRLLNISIQNHSVKNENDEIPKRLLKDEYYAVVRHPMYGTFVILYMGTLLSLRSLDGLMIALLMTAGTYMNAIIEEKRVLQPVFREEYQQYKKDVKAILLKKTQIFTLIIIMFFCIVGFLV